MKLLIRSAVAIFIVSTFFATVTQEVFADAPGYSGRVVSSTGAPISGVWVRMRDSIWLEFPNSHGESYGQYRYAKTENNGKFEFSSWHTQTESQANVLLSTPVDTDLDGINDDYMASIRDFNRTSDLQDRWWTAFDCGTGPMSFRMIIPRGQSGYSSTIDGIVVNNSDGGILDVGDIIYSGTLAPTPTPTTEPPSNIANANFGIVNLYTITGNVFFDANNNGVQDAGEPNHAGTPVINASRGTVTTGANGTYTIAGLTAGTVTVSFASLPSDYYMTYPLNGPPPSFQVIVGPGCDTNGSRGASCQ